MKNNVYIPLTVLCNNAMLAKLTAMRKLAQINLADLTESPEPFCTQLVVLSKMDTFCE